MVTKIISQVESKRALDEPEQSIFMGSLNPFKIFLYIYWASSTKRSPDVVEKLIDSAVVDHVR